MVIKAIFHSEERHVHLCKIFKDEESAVDWLNYGLDIFRLNDGCTLASVEDIPAANSVIAEICDDQMNIDNYISIEDIESELIEKIHEIFCEHQWSFDMLVAIANDLGINPEDTKTASLDSVHSHLELILNKEDIPIAYHPGECIDGIETVRKKEYVKAQLAKFSTQSMIEILDNVGYAFDENDRDEIEQLIVFEAAAQLADEFM